MENSIKKFKNSLKKSRKQCPWEKQQILESRAKELLNEAIEFNQAVEKKDIANMKEEFGDVFWDLLAVGIIAEEKKLFTMKGAIEDARKKLQRRKPWVFGKEKVSTAEEAVRRWNEIKKTEKN